MASPAVSASSSAPSYVPAAVVAGTRAQTQAVTMPTRRIRIRSHSDNPVVTIISLVLAVLIVGGGILVRYAIFKATQRNSTPPTMFNGPNGPQYGVTPSTYGTANYPRAARPSPAPRCTAPEPTVTSRAAIHPAARRAVKDPTERDSDTRNVSARTVRCGALTSSERTS